MQFRPALNQIFVAQPGMAAWVHKELRRLVDVSAWSDEWVQAQKRQIDKSDGLLFARRERSRETAAKRRRVTRLVADTEGDTP